MSKELKKELSKLLIASPILFVGMMLVGILTSPWVVVGIFLILWANNITLKIKSP